MNLGAVLGHPILATHEVLIVANQHAADAKLANQARAVPTGREAGGQSDLAVRALTTRVSKCAGFAMHRGIALLNAQVVAAAQQSAGFIEKRSTDRNAALGQAKVSLGNGYRQFFFIGGEHITLFEINCC